MNKILRCVICKFQTRLSGGRRCSCPNWAGKNPLLDKLRIPNQLFTSGHVFTCTTRCHQLSSSDTRSMFPHSCSTARLTRPPLPILSLTISSPVHHKIRRTDLLMKCVERLQKSPAAVQRRRKHLAGPFTGLI